MFLEFSQSSAGQKLSHCTLEKLNRAFNFNDPLTHTSAQWTQRTAVPAWSRLFFCCSCNVNSPSHHSTEPQYIRRPATCSLYAFRPVHSFPQQCRSVLDKLSIAKGLKNLFSLSLARRRLRPEIIIGLRYRLVFATSKWDFQFVYGFSETLCNDSQCFVIATLHCHPKSALRIWKPKEKQNGANCAWVKIEWSSEIGCTRCENQKQAFGTTTNTLQPSSVAVNS